MNRFAIRTVKNGLVTINGRTYRPDNNHMEYDGRFDGKRFAFGLYLNDICHVSLWGTEEAYRDSNVNSQEGPHLVDGYYPWLVWNKVDEE